MIIMILYPYYEHSYPVPFFEYVLVLWYVNTLLFEQCEHMKMVLRTSQWDLLRMCIDNNNNNNNNNDNNDNDDDNNRQ